MPGAKRISREDWPKIAHDLGRYDMRIAHDSTWYHEGRPIRRPELVKLFASVLRCDQQGQHWLVTPVEKGRIEVEEVAFLATQAHVTDQGTPAQAIALTTNVEERVELGTSAQLRIGEVQGQPRPYLDMRDGLRARLTPSVFYELIELGEERDGHLWLLSRGSWFDLGALDDPDPELETHA